MAFPATQVASTDPNTLDDYEEGTFLMTFGADAAPTGVTYGDRTMRYVKIGRLVWFGGRFTLTSKGLSGGGGVALGALPFVPTDYAAVAIARSSGHALTAGNHLSGVINSAGVIGLVQDGASGTTDVTWAMVTNSFDFMISGFYLAAA